MDNKTDDKLKYNKILGEKLRKVRLSKGINMSQLAEKIGKTSSYLSQIERGLAEPSITSLREISHELDVPLFYFLHDNNKYCKIVRKSGRKIVKLPDRKIAYELINPDSNCQMEVACLKIKPGNSLREEPLTHEGEKCLLVLNGEMGLQVGDEDFATLQEGDSIYFKGNLPHKISNITAEDLIIVSVKTPPEFANF